MSVGINDLLEVINIQENHRHGRFVYSGYGNQPLEGSIEITASVESGQAIVYRQFPEFLFIGSKRFFGQLVLADVDHGDDNPDEGVFRVRKDQCFCQNCFLVAFLRGENPFFFIGQAAFRKYYKNFPSQGLGVFETCYA